MIYFFADDHYGQHPGKTIFRHLPEDLRESITFTENDWRLLESGEWLKNCTLLILNMIGGTCDQPHPGAGAEKALRSWCGRGGNILLLHGSSAAFWQWEWWRKIVGLRWVRPGDPDGVAPSKHPVKPCFIRLAKCRHFLSSRLAPFPLGSDEIYTELEQVSPVTVLMDTFIEEGVFPQCAETVTEQGGKIVSFIPGHLPVSAADGFLIRNVSEIIRYLLPERREK